MELIRIGTLRSPFEDKFGTPRQAGLVPEVEGVIELLPPWDSAEAVRGLAGHSHLWVIFGFHRNRSLPESRSTVRPPRLGGNARLGVFATRSPYRPNPIGLSLVALEAVQPGRITVRGGDWIDGSPVYDVKPWLPWADWPVEGASQDGGGFASALPEPSLQVDFGPGLAAHPLAGRLKRMLGLDPRPAYRQRKDEEVRTYGMRHAGHEVRWRMDESGERLVVTEIRRVLGEPSE